VGILRTPLEEETTTPDGRLDFTDDALAVRLVMPDDEAPEPHSVLLDDPAPQRALAGDEDLMLVVRNSGTAVDGVVVSGATGRPVESFEVSFIEYWRGLIPRGSETLDVRDQRGRFAYELEEGCWAAEISAPGYATFRTPVCSAGSLATWSFGTIRLGPGGRLRGSVQASDGEPVSYARLYLLGPQMQTNRRPIYTAADGSYDASELPPATYTVFVLSPEHPLGIVRNVVIRESNTSPLDVRLDRPSPVTITVLDEAGEPVPGADVAYTCDALFPLNSRHLRSHEPPGWGGCRTDGEGRLHKAYLPAGRILFSVRAKGFAPAKRVVELAHDRENAVEIRLERIR
jgi:hypothetical protein